MGRDGLIAFDMARLSVPPARLARDPAEVAGWPRDAGGTLGLRETVTAVRPTVLIGASVERIAALMWDAAYD